MGRADGKQVNTTLDVCSALFCLVLVIAVCLCPVACLHVSPASIDSIRRCGHIQVVCGAAGASAAISLDMDSDSDEVCRLLTGDHGRGSHSESDQDSVGSDSSYYLSGDSESGQDSISSDSSYYLSGDSASGQGSVSGDSSYYFSSDYNGDSDRVDVESGGHGMDSDHEEFFESRKLWRGGVPVDIVPGSAVAMMALSRLSAPERLRADDDPDSERATAMRRIVTAMGVLNAQMPSAEVLIDRPPTQYDHVLPLQTSIRLPSLPLPHPHVTLSAQALCVALCKGREAHLIGGHPHKRDKSTVVYATLEQSQDCEQRLQSLCAGFEAELAVVEAMVAGCQVANKRRDDHYSAASYSPNIKADMMVEARTAVQRDILIVWLRSFAEACELSTIYLLFFLI